MLPLSQSFMNFEKNFEHEEIDEFLRHLDMSIQQRLQSLKDEYLSLSNAQFEHAGDMQSYRDHLTEQMISMQDVKDLGDELAIVALYKKVEAKMGRIIKKRIPSVASKNLSYFSTLSDVLPFDIKTVNGFDSFNELRLLNNSIKHGGVVSQELADNFSSWPQGAELKALGGAYSRVLPGVEGYVLDLVVKLNACGKP